MKKMTIRNWCALSLLAIGSFFGFSKTTLAQTCWLNFPPGGGPATVSITVPWVYGDYSAADNPSYFSDQVILGNPEVSIGSYLGWCIDFPDGIGVGPTVYSSLMFSSCDTNLDSELQALGISYQGSVYISPAAWNEVNYILNHKNGAYFYDIQVAIWNIIGGPVASYALQPPYPNTDSNAVNALLADAQSNAPSWTPECGNVIAVIVAELSSDESNPIQLSMIEVPYPCVPCISVTKQIACLQPTNMCGEFGSNATGYAGLGCGGAGGLDAPGFCYQISLTNCGTMPLTNIIVNDSLMGPLTTNFVSNANQVLAPGAGATIVVSMAVATNATNTVLVTGQAAITNGLPILTNVNLTLVTNGQTVSASSSATAQISTAALSCSLSLYSPYNMNPNNSNDVVLPEATYYSTPPTVTLSITVCNTGESGLSGVTINLPALSAFNCTAPAPFSLAPGGCQTYQLCLGSVSCPANLNFNVNVTGTVVPDANHCGVFDMTSTNLISACSSCSGSITCNTNSGCSGGNGSISGIVVLDCTAGSTNLTGDSGLSGLPVTLLGANNNPLATNVTDTNGAYSFGSLSIGTYYVLVSVPTNYTETYPIGVTNNEQAVKVVVCTNMIVNFGYANTTPPTISIMSAMSGTNNLGCNPANPPTISSVSAMVKAMASCGTASNMVTSICVTNGCSITQTFNITVTDSYGNSASTNVIYTYTKDTNAPVLSGVPMGKNLGCNPTNIPTLGSVQGSVSASDTCSPATVIVTCATVTNNCNVTQTFSVVATNACGNKATAYVTNTWSLDTNAPVLSGVPAGQNLNCNPASIPSAATIKAMVNASDTCSPPTVIVTGVTNVSGCSYTAIFTITATNACGNKAVAYVTNTWTIDTTGPVITGLPTNSYVGCSSTNLPTDTNVLNGISVTDACSTPSVTVSHVDSTNGCLGSRTFTIVAVDQCKNMTTTNVVFTWTILTPDYCTNSLCCSFNSKNPGSGWLWCNAHLTGHPGSNCTLYCQNASVTLNCTDGKTYTFPCPNGIVNFSSSCTVATNWFDGTNWNTTLPCAGDDQIFLQGCAIPWQWDFANCPRMAQPCRKL